MTVRAFHGDAAVRQSALRCLRGHCEAGDIAGGALFWSQGKGSAAAGLVETGEPADWSHRLGLAPWLAFAIDAVVTGLSGPDVTSAVSRLLQAVEPGRDTTLVGSHVIVAVLDRLCEAARGGGIASAELVDAAMRLRSVHARAAKGEAVPAPDWRSARTAAVLATDRLGESALRVVARGVEAGGWDPVASPATVGEVLGAWLACLTQADVDTLDWSVQDHAQVQVLLDDIYEKYIESNPAETRDVFQLLAVYHPATELRLRAFAEGSREAQRRSCWQGVYLLETELTAASASWGGSHSERR